MNFIIETTIKYNYLYIILFWPRTIALYQYNHFILKKFSVSSLVIFLEGKKKKKKKNWLTIVETIKIIQIILETINENNGEA